MTTTTTGHTLTIDTDAMLVRITGDLDTMQDIPEAEIDAACARADMRCTYDAAGPDAYRIERGGRAVRQLDAVGVGAVRHGHPDDARFEPTEGDLKWVCEQLGRKPSRDEWRDAGLAWVGDAHVADDTADG